MRNAGIGSWPERRARIAPERDALWFEGVTVSHGGFAERVRRVAGALAGLGVRAGDRVGWFGANHPAGFETLFACGQLGAIWVPVNARLTAPEAAYILGNAGAAVVVHGAAQRDVVAALEPLLPRVAAWVGIEGGPAPGTRCGYSYESLLEAAVPAPRDEPVSLDDPCAIMYTSGTTGRPKGAVLTHGNMAWNAMNQLIGLDFGHDERVLALSPLFHIGGLGNTLPALMHGGCVLLSRGFHPAETLTVMAEQRATSFFAVPTMLDAMAREPGFTALDLSALRSVIVAGAPVPLQTLRTWTARGLPLQQCYGMTEAAPGCTLLLADDAARKLGSAGKPLLFTDVRVLRRDGSVADVDEVGEIAVSGPNVMAGYWRDPETTAEVLSGGWFRTGDAGSFDADGYLYIRDRYKDVIISGGENLYPAEIESALLELDGVAEAAVIGVPDPTWGETPLAYIVPFDGSELTPEGIRSALRSRLAGFKLPRYVRFVGELPKTAAGKVRKPDLRADYELGKKTEEN